MSSTVLRILLVVAIFAAVLGATYPIQRQAVEEEKAHKYQDIVALDLNRSKKHYDDIESAAAKGNVDIDARLAAGNAYASSLLTVENFAEAARVYQEQLGLTWGLVNNGYNKRWADASMRLAGAHRDMDNQSAALVCYDSVLKHDQQFLPEGDPRIARDLNNIGLMHYLIGTGKSEPAQRKTEFQESRKYLEQSLASLEKQNQGKSARAAASMWNLFLTCRDLDDQAAASQYRTRALEIDKSFNRVCREP